MDHRQAACLRLGGGLRARVVAAETKERAQQRGEHLERGRTRRRRRGRRHVGRRLVYVCASVWVCRVCVCVEVEVCVEGKCGRWGRVREYMLAGGQYMLTSG